jgi:acetolactate synthase-1/2/3 large subunit
MLVHEALAATLIENDVRPLFGLVGDANLFVVDSYVRMGGQYVPAANEANVVLMAAGYASVSGKCGFATVTHGPALTNTMTALVDAVRGRIPIVLIAGDTAVEAREHLQKVDQHAFILATGAGLEQVRTPATAVGDFVEAQRRALAERRPIVLNFPSDFQWVEVETSPKLFGVAPIYGSPGPEALDDVVGLIAGARAPIVLAGLGAVNAQSEMIALAEALGAPLMTTLRNRDVYSGHPQDFGVFGMSSTERGLAAIAAADCVIAFGASLNRWTTDTRALLSGIRVVQVDTDLSQVGRFAAPDFAVMGDAAEVANTITGMLAEAEFAASGFANSLAKPIGRPADKDQEPNGPLDVVTTMRVLDHAVPRDRTLAMDGGRYVFAAIAELHVASPRAYVHGASTGAIGLGVGLAIGAAMASAERPTLLIAGDGGFMLGGINDLGTAVRENLDLIVALIDDGAYGAEHIQFTQRDMDPSLSYNRWPDLGAVVSALGAEVATFRTYGDLQTMADRVASRSGVLVLHIIVDPDRRGAED